MHEPGLAPRHEALLIRVVWMLVFFCAWWVVEALLGILIVAQLIYRLLHGAPHACLMSWGDSFSQFLAQIGRFGCFHTEQKPWPFADWPAARQPDNEPSASASADKSNPSR